MPSSTAHFHTNRRAFRPIFPLIFLASLVAAAPALWAAPLTGTVTNKTTNKPSAGDTVVMLNLSQGMQEGGRTKTDAHGRYTLDPGDGPHLIRVDHQKASYFHMAPPGTTSADIDVYDVLVKVPEVKTEADVIRVEADQQGLHVVENYWVRNDSSPPKTQFSDHAFEISLPPDAQIEASAALSPGGMPVSSSPTPLGDKGHYAFIFPIRPGETRFQLSYRIPYTGSYNFAPHEYTLTETVAIMLPKGMTFTEGPSSGYQPDTEDVNVQTFVAKNVSPSQPLEFTVTGLGSMPREEQAGQSQGAGTGPNQGGADTTGQGAPATAAGDTRPGGGLGAPLDSPDPLKKYRWWILGGLTILLAGAAAFLLRGKPADNFPADASLPAHPVSPQGFPITAPHLAAQPSLLGALKDELFTLETERLEGKITEADYAQAKSALEVVLRRALARQAS